MIAVGDPKVLSFDDFWVAVVVGEDVSGVDDQLRPLEQLVVVDVLVARGD